MKKLYLTILCMVLTISVFCFNASASTFYDNDGFLTAEGSNYNSSYDYTITYPSSTPVIDSSVEIPSNYTLLGTAVYTYSSLNVRKLWIYYPSGGTPPTLRNSSQDSFNYHLQADSSYQFYVVTNKVINNGTYSFWSKSSDSNIQSSYYKFTFYLPVKDSNGNLLRPENQIYFNLNSTYDTDTMSLFFNASSSSYTDNNVHFYMFPSSVNISSGSTSTLITEKYVNELTMEESGLLDLLGFHAQYKIWQANKDVSVFSVLPEFVFLDTTSSTRFGANFDPSVYGVPYLDLGAKNFHASDDIYLTQTFCLNVPNMDKSKSGLYLYNDLCIVAVVEYENIFFTTRFDFNRNVLKTYGIVAPSYPSPPDSYSSGTVSDLQDLADYLQYLYTTNDNNRTKQDNNIIAYLQAIPWGSYIATGTHQGLLDWLPELSDSIDYTFGNLFSDYFIPTPEQMSELEDELEDDREEFEAKFAFIDDVKDEVSFIFETIMRSGDQTRYFEFNLTNYHGVGVVQMNISDKIPANVLTIVKNFITCFLTIAVVMHIFKTLPSTIGKMPSGGD